jgi:hypothetical protein
MLTFHKAITRDRIRNVREDKHSENKTLFFAYVFKPLLDESFPKKLKHATCFGQQRYYLKM